MNFFYGLVVALIIYQSFFCVIANEQIKNDTKIHTGIHKRGLFYPVLLYPYNAATGILVAIAIPLSLPDRNVFLSYNFEMNYNMPNQASDSFPGVIVRFPGLLGNVSAVTDGTPDDVIVRSFDKSDDEPEKIKASEKLDKKSENEEKIVLSRKGVYRVFESRINANGIDGKKCLLLAICEAAKYQFIEYNGVLGHILHIVLTPSTSIDEDLPKEYAKAENLGQQKNCEKYERKCGISLLSMISKLF